MTEKQIIHGCQNGAKGCQYELVKQYAGMLMSVCRRYAKDEAMAKDILQETLLRIFANIGKYEPTGSFEAWMRRIAVRRSLQWIEKSCFQHEAQPDELPNSLLVEPVAETDLAAEEIMRLVLGLPLGYRTVFCLYVVEGYQHSEISAMLNISENTSRSQLSRARQLLQQKLAYHNLNLYHELGTVRK